jgi:hypothetical protein
MTPNSWWPAKKKEIIRVIMGQEERVVFQAESESKKWTRNGALME